MIKFCVYLSTRQLIFQSLIPSYLLSFSLRSIYMTLSSKNGKHLLHFGCPLRKNKVSVSVCLSVCPFIYLYLSLSYWIIKKRSDRFGGNSEKCEFSEALKLVHTSLVLSMRKKDFFNSECIVHASLLNLTIHR